MPISDFGSVCDISVLSKKEFLDIAQELFSNCGLYIPSPTYSWLSRSKLIEVRNQRVRYSLINPLVRDGKIYPIHLPDLYDEISRQIMFETDHQVALTDLRGLILATHLQLPILTFDANLMDRVSEEIGMLTIENFTTYSNWMNIKNVLKLYRELSFKSGELFKDRLENGKTFPETTRELKRSQKNYFRKVENSFKKAENEEENSGKIEFGYITWDIVPSIQDYYEQNIVTSKILRQICEKCILLVASPPKPLS